MIGHPHNIIVAGTPGAWTNVVVSAIATQGWAITWPDQDLDNAEAQKFLQNNSQNFEMHNIHQQLCEWHNVSLFSQKLPDFYHSVYPGPTEYLAKFKTPVVLSSISLPPFLDLWVGASNVVIDIRATAEEDFAMLNHWSQNKFALDHIQVVRDNYVNRYVKHLKLFSKVFTMTNEEAKNRQLTGLAKFLNSAF
jgi:hypothetical protein